MCWGFQPTLVFVLAESIVLGVLIWRKEYNDRLNAFLHVPLFTQEAVQLALWAVLDKEINTTPDQCGPWNSLLSIAEAVIVGYVPGWFALYVSMSRETPSKVRQRLRGLAVLWAGYTLIVIFDVICLQMVGMLPHCTTAGPWGHQIWPFLVVNPWPLRILLCAIHLAFYCGFITISLVEVKFESVALGGFFAIYSLPPVLYLFIGNEWGSFWCFSASLICPFYLLEPTLLRTPSVRSILQLGERSENVETCDDFDKDDGLKSLMLWHATRNAFLEAGHMLRQVIVDRRFVLPISADLDAAETKQGEEQANVMLPEVVGMNTA